MATAAIRYGFSTLPTGLRLATCTVPHARSFTAVARLAVGSRHDPPGKDGLAHLAEHVAASGTDAYPTASALAAVAERVGGYTDAETDPEATSFRAAVPARHAERALEVLAETIVRPRLDPVAIARERGVVRHELAEGTDDAERADELAARALWGDHPLARDPAGTRESVAALTAEDVRAFAESAYTGPACVVAAVGPLDHEAVVEMVGRAFAGIPASTAPPSAHAPVVRPRGRGLWAERSDAERLQLRLVFPGLAAGDPDQPALWVVDALLDAGRAGGRVYDRLREQLGVVYEAGAAPTSYRDGGLYAVHASVAPRDVVRALEAAWAEASAVRAGLSAAEVAEAVEYLVGWNEMAADAFEGFADHLARDVLDLGGPRTLEETTVLIAAVTPDDVARVAARVLDPARARIVVVGPWAGADADALRRVIGAVDATAPPARRFARRRVRGKG
ncbi:MAG TPA: pitrilysin family protein [Chloroflexota bacterium]